MMPIRAIANFTNNHQYHKKLTLKALTLKIDSNVLKTKHKTKTIKIYFFRLIIIIIIKIC